MKRYVNKTRFMKRIVFFTDKKAGKTTTQFLGQGQAVLSSSEVSFIEDGIKVRDEQPVTKTAKKQNTDEGKE